MDEVALPRLRPDRFRDLLDETAWAEFSEQLAESRRELGERTLWHVNSTAHGGGVAEMLQSLLGYLVGAGIPTRWAVLQGSPQFFQLTKRIHNHLHGSDGDGGRLGQDEMALYQKELAQAGRWISSRLHRGDVVVLHDPQALGLGPALARQGATVIWSCHIGVDQPNPLTRTAWARLLPYASPAAACVFSRPDYVWEGLDPDRVVVIPPCLDAFSPKNQDLEKSEQDAILVRAGLVTGKGAGAPARFQRQDGSRAPIRTTAEMTGGPVPQGAPLVAQVSRWDPLKDHPGVLRAFSWHVPEELGAHLVLAGPDPKAVADDPEGAASYRRLLQAREELEPGARERVHLACLPMQDPEENAAMVNALQRRSQVVVQKSLAEGFGLTVAEAMWKRRAVVGSRVGGIQDQIEDGRSGVLVDPQDLAQVGQAIARLLGDPEERGRLGERAHRRVCRDYLAPRYLGDYLRLIGTSVAAPVLSPSP